jgi:DNA-binding SARP family transcriptional activator/tetratricopeptide (TPR) repeat protein
MLKLAISLLGAFQVNVEDGRKITFASDKSRALLAYLAVEAGRPHRREVLAELLWPGRPETLARNNLRQTVHQCRLALGDRNNSTPCLLTTPRTLQINPDCEYWLDVAEFTQLVSTARKHHPQGISLCESCLAYLLNAAHLYKGDFLPGITTFGSPSFEWWLLSRQEALHLQAMETFSTLARHFENRHDFNAACLYTRKVLALEPWRETAHRQLMRLLAQGGQHSAALRQFEECKHILVNELMTTPSPETTRLYESIRAGKLTPLDESSRYWVVREASINAPEGREPAIVARERELSQIAHYLEAAHGGQGQVVFVTGEAGSGKTTLLREAAYQAMRKHGDLIVAGGVCNAYTSVGDPYYPFIEILRTLAGEGAETGLKSKLTEEQSQRAWAIFPVFLRALIRHGPALIGSLIMGEPLLAAARAHGQISEYELKRLEDLVARNVRMRSLAPEALYKMLEQRSGEMIELGGLKDNQFALVDQLTQVLKSLAHRHPLVLIVDDMQWLDHASAGVLLHLGRSLRSSPILVLGAFRSEGILSTEGARAWPLVQVIQELEMHEWEVEIDLAQADGRRFVDAIIDTEPNDLDETFRQSLYNLTGGHALFTVEVLRGMQKRGDLRRNATNRWVQTESLCWEQIPTRVEATISERLHCLSEDERKLLSVASVQGESFTAEVAAKLLGIDVDHILSQLSGALSKKHKLVSALGVQRIGERTLSQFRFCHQLHQKCIYQRLDAVERARMHEATGRELETLIVQPSVESRVRMAGASLIAWHFEQAGLALKAASSYLQAGIDAYQICANEEAIANFNRGLNLLDSLREPSDEIVHYPTEATNRTRLELTLLLALCAPLRALEGHAGPNVGNVCRRAAILAQQMGDETRHFFAQWLHLTHLLSKADYQSALRICGLLAKTAKISGEPIQLAQVDFALGMVKLHIGEFKLAREHFEKVYATSFAQEGDLTTTPMINSLRSCSLMFDAWALWFLGKPDQAMERSREGVSLAESTGNPNNLAFAMALGDCVMHFLRREYPPMERKAAILRKLATEQGFSIFSAWGRILQGRGQVEQGDLLEGFGNLEEGVADYHACGQRAETTLFLAAAAEAYMAREEGLNALSEARDFMQASGETYFAAEMSRLRGECLLATESGQGSQVGPGLSEAEACFRDAIHIAQQQEARSLELRAAISLSRLLQRLNRGQEALPILDEIYSMFDEGFGTRDLMDARALLEDLS